MLFKKSLFTIKRKEFSPFSSRETRAGAPPVSKTLIASGSVVNRIVPPGIIPFPVCLTQITFDPMKTPERFFISSLISFTRS